MAELVITLTQTKEDVVKALKNKALLKSRGIEVESIIVREGSEDIPIDFLEDMLKLEITGVVKKSKD